MHDPVTNGLLLTLLIALTMFAYFFAMYLRGKRAAYFGNLKTLERVHGFRHFHVSPWVLLVKVIIVSLLFIVATETVEVRKMTPIADTDYVILIDASSSMANTDYNPTRLAAAKEISKSWVRILGNNTRVGLIAFSQDIQNLVPLTFDKKKVEREIDLIQIDYSKSGTSIDYALSSGYDLLKNSRMNKEVLLLTDGTEGVESRTIANAKAGRIKIYSFGIGSAVIDETPEEYRDMYSSLAFNFTKLDILSNATGASAYKVGNSLELEYAFREATLEKIDIPLNSGYYIIILIAVISILELLLYSKLGGL
ncbi:MAG: VWA domain-containing protein [archaeon]